METFTIPPAQISNSSFAYPSDPMGYFYFSLGTQKLENSINFVLNQTEIDHERLLLGNNHNNDNSDLHFGESSTIY